jgi:hypothetical protein
MDPQRRQVQVREDHQQDFDHGQVYPAQDYAIDRQTQIEGAKAAEESRGLAAVAQFGQLEVSHHARSPPQARKEKHGEHVAEQQVPPEPIAGDAVSGHQPGDRQGVSAAKVVATMLVPASHQDALRPLTK